MGNTLISYAYSSAQTMFSTLIDFKVRSTLEHNLTLTSKELLNDMDDFTVTLIKVFPEKLLRANEIGEGGVHTDLTKKCVRLGWKKNNQTQKAVDKKNDDLVPDEENGYSESSSAGNWQPAPADETEVEVSDDVFIKMITDDDVFGKGPLSSRILLTAFANELLFPLKDIIQFPQEDEVNLLLKELRLAPGMAMPEPYHDWKEMSSDEAMSRIYFYGIGVVYIKQHNIPEYDYLGPFFVDFEEISTYDIRPGFRKYGVRIHFSETQQITAIYDYAKQRMFTPHSDETEWEKAKFLAKQTTAAMSQCREHLLWSHLLCSNAVARANISHLPPTHPIRRLLAVFTFRTNYINNRATKSLLPERSLIHRCTAFTYESLQQFMENSTKNCDLFEPFNQIPVGDKLKKLSKEGKFPYYEDGMAFYEIVESFVVEWLKASGSQAHDEYAQAFYEEVREVTQEYKYTLPPFSSPNALVDLLTQFIFIVTAYHEAVGNFVHYTQRIPFAGMRIVEGSTCTDLQSFLVGACITALTGIRTPALMSSFSNFFGKDGAPGWERILWDDLQAKLTAQAQHVKKENETRQYGFRYYDPVLFECAISV